MIKHFTVNLFFNLKQIISLKMILIMRNKIFNHFINLGNKKLFFFLLYYKSLPNGGNFFQLISNEAEAKIS